MLRESGVAVREMSARSQTRRRMMVSRPSRLVRRKTCRDRFRSSGLGGFLLRSRLLGGLLGRGFGGRFFSGRFGSWFLRGLGGLGRLGAGRLAAGTARLLRQRGFQFID